jgi:hypothetical protein
MLSALVGKTGRIPIGITALLAVYFVWRILRIASEGGSQHVVSSMGNDDFATGPPFGQTYGSGKPRPPDFKIMA